MPPVLIGAVIAGGAAIGSAAIANNGQKKAAQAAQQGNDASLAVQRDIYNQNAAALAPWQQSGLTANNYYMAALGIPQGNQVTTPTPGTATAGMPTGQWAPGMTTDGTPGSASRYGMSADQLNSFNNSANMATGSSALDLMRAQVARGTAPTTLQPSSNGTVFGGSQQSVNPGQAFDAFRNSTGYNFRLDQGQNALNSGYAGAGLVRSGAALQGLNDYSQNMASAEFNNWLGALEGASNRGLGAASAQAGVGQSYANNVSNLNASNAATQAQLALARSQTTAGAIGALGQIGGYAAGSILQPQQSALTNGWGTPGLY